MIPKTSLDTRYAQLCRLCPDACHVRITRVSVQIDQLLPIQNPRGPYRTYIKTQLLIPYGSQMGHKGFMCMGMPRFYPKPAWPIF